MFIFFLLLLFFKKHSFLLSSLVFVVFVVIVVVVVVVYVENFQNYYLRINKQLLLYMHIESEREEEEKEPAPCITYIYCSISMRRLISIELSSLVNCCNTSIEFVIITIMCDLCACSATYVLSLLVLIFFSFR